MGRNKNGPKYVKCVEKKDRTLTSKDTLRQIIWRVCPFLATSVTKYSAQGIAQGIMFQKNIINSIEIQCLFDTMSGLRNVLWTKVKDLMVSLCYQQSLKSDCQKEKKKETNKNPGGQMVSLSCQKILHLGMCCCCKL